MQTTKVTSAMIKELTMAFPVPYSAMVKPTESASIEVAGCLTVFIIRTFQKAYKGFIFLSNIKFIFARYLLLLYNNSVHD